MRAFKKAITTKLSEELSWRGFVNQTTLKDISELDKQKFTLYLGVDPSADSMQVGNLAAIMMVRHFMEHGHKVIMLVGGGTGMIGDPGGKSEERNLLTLKQIAHNKKAISAQYRQIFGSKKFTLVDNYNWLSRLGLLEFLRDVGKHFSMTNLVQRDFIATRMGEGGSGISYTEFSYTLLQGYDYLHLHEKYGVDLQVCGSDQWGNSISGVELIRKKTGDETHVYSCPLIVNKTTGKKFGKSEDGAVWLDPHKTSVYKFYQFWLNSEDDAVEEYLKFFTMLNKAQVEKVMAVFKQKPNERVAQKILAYELTKLVHGEKRARGVKRLTEILFTSQDYTKLRSGDYDILKNELPLVTAKPGVTTLVETLVLAKLATSNSDARRLLEGGAIYINGLQISSEKTTFDQGDGKSGYAVLRRGKNAVALVKLSQRKKD